MANSAISASMLKYPIAVVENSPAHRFTGFMIVRRQTGFSVLGRVPNSQKFGEGHVFDSAGQIFCYAGSSGKPRFSPGLCVILDNLLVPGFLSKLIELFLYFGPELVSREKLLPAEFKSRLLSAIEAHGSEDVDELRQVLVGRTGFQDILEGVDWWRYCGGRRDRDGHPV